ncbi:MAG: VacJ family lipoprotein [bacterium]
MVIAFLPVSAQGQPQPDTSPAPAPPPGGVQGFEDPFSTGTGKDKPEKIQLADPLEPWNRAVMTVNEYGFEYVAEPVARAYRDYTPSPVRESFKRFFSNLYEPTYAVNSVLQGRWHDASVASRRFLINSTFGGAGFFDPAGEHLDQVERDFDQTLGKWGISPGFYLVWPLIGPSSPRGTVGYLVDETLDPLNYAGDLESVTVVSMHRIISETSYSIGQFETLEKFSVDNYSAIKDYYEKQLYKKRHQ